MIWSDTIDNVVWDQLTALDCAAPLADGVDCSYICDVAVLPSHQVTGLGKAIVTRVVGQSQGHKSIILHSVRGKQPFYRKSGFRWMRPRWLF